MQMQKNIHSFELQTEKFEHYFREELGCTGHIEMWQMMKAILVL